MKRRLLKTTAYLLGLVVSLIVLFMAHIWNPMGSAPSGERRDRISQSEQYRDGKFDNKLPSVSEGFSLSIIKKYIKGGSNYRKPEANVSSLNRTATDFSPRRKDLRVTWLGHSTMIVEMEDVRILIDPVFGDYASPNQILGIKRFYESPLSLDNLPELDAVVISHDHYDHLDFSTIKALKDRVPQFVVPLGVGSHLEYWGVEASKIVELDWWEEFVIRDLRLISTPARHFSGRSLTDRNATLWSGWAFIGSNNRLFYSGDSAMGPHFSEIGERLGPFDMTLMESGAYDPLWTDVHMGPEQAVLAHQMVKGGLLVPVHWGLFDLALHGWTEPAERIRIAATKQGIPVAFPMPGASVTREEYDSEAWWPDTPWDSVTRVPIVSTGLDASIVDALK